MEADFLPQVKGRMISGFRLEWLIPSINFHLRWNQGAASSCMRLRQSSCDASTAAASSTRKASPGCPSHQVPCCATQISVACASALGSVPVQSPPRLSSSAPIPVPCTKRQLATLRATECKQKKAQSLATDKDVWSGLTALLELALPKLARPKWLLQWFAARDLGKAEGSSTDSVSIKCKHH
jgi:hypothetical protein